MGPANMLEMIVRYELFFVGLTALYWLILFMTIYNVLREEEGIDRLTWIVTVVAVPLFGIIFFYLGVGRELNQDEDEPRDPDSWKKSLR